MIFGDLVGLKFPDICLIGEENTEKTSPGKPFPTGDGTRARCVTGAHATACSTAVDVHLTLWANFRSFIGKDASNGNPVMKKKTMYKTYKIINKFKRNGIFFNFKDNYLKINIHINPLQQTN